MNEKDNALAIIQGDAAIETAKRRQNEVLAIKQAVFQPGVHFGPPYPGAKNDTLLKPGATFLQQKYGLRAQHERMETTIHVDTSDLSKSYIIIQDRCRIVLADTGAELAQADAACSTFEDKYLFRNAQRVCPTCGQATIFKSNDDKRPGFYCWTKKGGCGARFAANDPTIIGQETGKSANENPLNLLDTIVAMAQKRAEVRATIKATGVDALFSPGDGVTVEYLDVDEPPTVRATARKVDVVTGEIIEDAPPAEAPATPKAANAQTERIAETPAGSYTKLIGKVYSAVSELYKDSRGIVVSEHMRNSIAKLEEIGALLPEHTVDQAIEIVRSHKAKQPAA